MRALRVTSLAVIALALSISAEASQCPGRCQLITIPFNCLQDGDNHGIGCAHLGAGPCVEFICDVFQAQATCDNAQLVEEVLSGFPTGSSSEEVLHAFQQAAQNDPRFRTLVDGLRILSPEGVEVYRGPAFAVRDAEMDAVPAIQSASED